MVDVRGGGLGEGEVADGDFCADAMGPFFPALDVGLPVGMGIR